MDIDLGFHCHRLSHIEERILPNGLTRGEFYHFPGEQIPLLEQSISRYDLAASVHCPLVKPSWYPEPPTWAFLCDSDRDKRELNLRMVKETLEMAAKLGIEYVVVHFPSPPSHDAGDKTYEERRDIVWDSARRLADLSERYAVPVHIEGFGPSPFLHADFIVELLSALSPLRYCYDTGHMHIAAQRDGIDAQGFLQDVAPYIGSMHVWNTRGLKDYMQFRHIPVHPSQHPEEGWADIAGIVGT
ncbi:MAG: sugar phosphate isomerase/epimerase family protein, partial [Chloroflexota bacterium]